MPAAPTMYPARLSVAVLQVFLFLLLLSVVVAIAGGYTGGAEKVVLAATVVALVWLVSRVRRIGGPAPGA